MKLNLKRPIAFFDIESTGVNISSDRIIEIAIIKMNPNGSREVKRKLINPGMDIPDASIAIHGITNEMVQNAPLFKQVAHELKQFIENCDLGGYNCLKFDVPILAEEFLRAGVDARLEARRIIDVQRIYHTMEPRTLSAAYKYYCQKTLENAHSAEADTDATIEVLDKQLDMYPELGDNLDSILLKIGEDEIVDFARRLAIENDVVVFNFGKHKGKPVEDIFKTEPSYYDWMMKGDFAQHTKQRVTAIFHKLYLNKK